MKSLVGLRMTLVQLMMSVHIRLEIQSAVCCKCMVTASSWALGSNSRVGLVGSFPEQLGGGDPVASLEKPAHPHLLLKPAAVMGPLYYFL